MSLAAIVDRIADNQPDNIAIAGLRSVTYLELTTLSRQISTVLLAGKCRRIGIFLPQSIDFFVALIGINRIGSAFVPLDPTLPIERLRQMVEKSGIDAIISSKDLVDSLSFFRKKVFFTESIYANQNVTADQDYPLAPGNLCYVIFTSGSTGHPKGCMVSYQNLENFIQNAKDIYSLDENDRVLQFASISFDTFLEEACSAWGAGAALVLKRKNRFSSHHEFLQFVAEERISVLDLPSSLWHSLIDELEATTCLSLPSCLTTIIVGGESVSLKHVRIWLAKYNRVRVINTYGISECAIVNSFWKPTSLSDLDNHDHTPIGKPLENISFLVLDEQSRPVAVDKMGELYISGASVGDGYINDDELTRASFITDILHNGSGTVFYKTGDIVKPGGDGLFEYVGRIGSFININGIRVDLGEIENVIKRFPGVQDCKVIYSAKVNAGIHAFIKSQAGPGYQSVVMFAQQYLPQYMIPRTVCTLAEFPVNRHGKISESELLKVVEEKRAHGRTAVPLTEVQAKLKGIFLSILQRDEVGLDETFFSLGGDSIRSMNLLSQVKTAYNLDIPIDYLFGNGTISGLADYIDNADAGTHSDEENAFFLLNRVPFKDKTILLIPGSLGDVLCYSDLVKDLEVDNPIYGTSYPGRYDDKTPLESLTEYARYYADSIQRQKLQEPFVIAGYSSGGWIAYTLANELLNRNVTVERIFLIDSAQPNFVDPLTSRRSTLIPPFSLNLLWFFWGLVRFFGNELVQSPGAIPMLLRDTISGLTSGKLSHGMTVDEVKVLPTYLYFCARIGFFGRELSIPSSRYARSSEKERFAIILQEGKKISLFPDAYTIQDIERSWQMILSIVRIENINSMPPSKNRLVLIRTKPHYGLRMFFPAGKKHDFDWGKLVGNQIKVFELAGNHLQILRRPSIKKVAEIMRSNL